MTNRLPPLNALRAFEAVARLGSVKDAAEELGVTSAAISHQIRQLEDGLGVALLRRNGRSVALTDAGTRCYPGVREGFDALRRAMEHAAGPRRGETAQIAIAAGPAFTAKWLLPRLRRFAAIRPDAEVRLRAGTAFDDFDRDGIDVAIRFGRVDATGLVVERLAEETVAPMCSPALLGGDAPLAGAADLRHHALIHDESLRLVEPSAPDWAQWLGAQGVRGVDAGRGLRFNLADHALDAAAGGAGVLLGRTVLAAGDLQAGRLAVPFGPEMPTGLFFHLVCRPAALGRPVVAAFRSWILAEFAGTSPVPPAVPAPSSD
ncbi:MAG TPA: transcriptional regulator GcvA [Alphaproteobacteria bacterium]|nr:transcriptional regulator GcvA [Alphaproteobacteria bacterium]